MNEEIEFTGIQQIGVKGDLKIEAWCFLVPEQTTDKLHHFLSGKIRYSIVQEVLPRRGEDMPPIDAFYLDRKQSEEKVTGLIKQFEGMK